MNINKNISGEKIVFQNELNIDGTKGNFFVCTITTNSSLSLSNISVSKIHYIIVNNTSAATITITLPNTADIKSAETVDINTGSYIELSLIYDGTNRYWQISEELN